MAASLLGAAGHLAAQNPAAAEDIRGPKPLVEIPVPEKPHFEFWLGVGGGVLLVLVAWFIWRSYRGKQRRKSPPEIALASLAELEANRESLEAEAFANRAAQTVRQYIADRFGIAAPRRTTEEFLRDLAKDESQSLAGESDHLRVFLKSCDLAKFAGSNLDTQQRGELVQAARSFVTSTAVSNSTSTALTP
ncbi:MAG: DUF4381 family protein [Luteolibacter sp.]|uniref:DUF4381 family protein n=1 Tax=Luteolibacter sp. TaxID=1962973 RepID=UPI003264C060